MSVVADRELQMLVSPPPGDGRFLSCYASCDTGDAHPNWLRDFESRTSDLHRSIHANDELRAELDLNVLAVRRILAADAPATTPWIAVFSSIRRDFLHAIRLDVPVAPDLSFGKSPQLVPLLRALHQRREYLVVQADTHRARLFSATAAAVTNLLDVDEPVPQKQHSSGERYGYEQNIIGRHRDDRIRHVRKELAEQVEKHWTGASYSGLVLLGEHVTTEHLRESLPPRLREAIVHEEAVGWDDRGSEVRKAIHRIAAALQGHSRISEAIRSRIHQGKAVAFGSGAVLEALDHGRIGADGHGGLVFGPDAGEMIGRCTACHSLSIEPLGACTKCAGPCSPSSLQQELLLAARRRRIAVHFTEEAAELRPYGGVVGLLSK